MAIPGNDYTHLAYSASSFRQGNTEDGFREFALVPQSQQNNVYTQLWVNKNSPIGNSEYGRHSFHNSYGHYSTLSEKAQAIEDMVWRMTPIRTGGHSFKRTRPVYANKFYIDNNGRSQYGYVLDSFETSDMWCPSTKEECLQVALGVTAFGAASAIIYGVVKVVSYLR